MRILITGVSGFIGQYAAERFTDRGHEVHGLYEHAASKLKNPGVPDDRKHLANLTDHERIAQVVATVKPHVVFHFAARSEVALSFANYVDVSQTNYVGTVNLAEACRLVPGFEMFVMASTMETYGATPGPPAFTEDTPQFPIAPYAVAKVACERYLAYMGYAYDFPHVVLRQTNTYGRRDNDFFIVERIISQMLAGPVCNLGAGWPIRNFLFIDDLVNLYEALLDQRPLGETFVTGPDNAVTIERLASMIADKLDWRDGINWGTIPPRAGEVPYLSSRADKAKERLGWEPRIGLSEGLDRTIELWRGALDGTMEPTWQLGDAA